MNKQKLPAFAGLRSAPPALAGPSRSSRTQRASGGWRSAVKDLVELLLIVWAFPIALLALVLPIALLDAAIRAALHLR